MSFSISCQQQAGRFSFFSPSLCSYQSLSFVADTCRSLHVGNQKYFFNTAWQIRPWDLSQWITILELQVGHGSWWSSHITSWTESLAEDFGLLSESLITSFHCSGVVDGRINWYQVHTLYLHAFYLLWDSVSLVCCKFKWQCAFLPLCTKSISVLECHQRHLVHLCSMFLLHCLREKMISSDQISFHEICSLFWKANLLWYWIIIFFWQ